MDIYITNANEKKINERRCPSSITANVGGDTFAINNIRNIKKMTTEAQHLRPIKSDEILSFSFHLNYDQPISLL